MQRRKCNQLDEAGEQILREATAELGIGTGAHSRILQLGRTIADLADSRVLTAGHATEAVCLHRLVHQPSKAGHRPPQLSRASPRCPCGAGVPRPMHNTM